MSELFSQAAYDNYQARMRQMADDEIARLREENRLLRLENEALRKQLAKYNLRTYF